MTSNRTASNRLNLPQAEEHPLLKDLTAQMMGAQVRDDLTTCGHTYTMETLWPYEEAWADNYVSGENIYQVGRSRRLAYVAASLRAIDGVSVSQLFKLPDSTPEATRAEFEANPLMFGVWQRDQLLQRLLSETSPMLSPQVLTELWVFYQNLDERRQASLEKIGPLSTSGGAGAPSPTSSVEKAS